MQDLKKLVVVIYLFHIHKILFMVRKVFKKVLHYHTLFITFIVKEKHKRQNTKVCNLNAVNLTTLLAFALSLDTRSSDLMLQMVYS